jgi:hypothetical protein
MFTTKRVVTAAVLAAAVLIPSPALADRVLTPFAGLAFKGTLPDTKLTWGTSLLMTGEGWTGVEIDFGHTPSFYGDGLVPDADSSLTTLMASLAVGLPFGGEHGPGIRPYAIGGMGLMRSHLDAAAGDTTVNQIGITGGAGIMLFFGDHTGLRGDLRYFRALQDFEVDNAGGIDLDTVNFWRATIGFSLRF